LSAANRRSRGPRSCDRPRPSGSSSPSGNNYGRMGGMREMREMKGTREMREMKGMREMQQPNKLSLASRKQPRPSSRGCAGCAASPRLNSPIRSSLVLPSTLGRSRFVILFCSVCTCEINLHPFVSIAREGGFRAALFAVAVEQSGRNRVPRSAHFACHKGAHLAPPRGGRLRGGCLLPNSSAN
jgi:hypothetical protein